MRGFWGSRAFLRGVVKLPSLRGLFRPEDTFSLGATTIRYTPAHVTAAPFSLARGLFLVGGPTILVAVYLLLRFQVVFFIHSVQ